MAAMDGCMFMTHTILILRNYRTITLANVGLMFKVYLVESSARKFVMEKVSHQLLWKKEHQSRASLYFSCLPYVKIRIAYLQFLAIFHVKSRLV